jgi:hypothetical protein
MFEPPSPASKRPIHTISFDIVGFNERGGLDMLSGLTGSSPWRLCALIVPVALDLGALRRQMKVGQPIGRCEFGRGRRSFHDAGRECVRIVPLETIRFDRPHAADLSARRNAQPMERPPLCND